MVCSFYGEKFQGKPTANGEIFDMEKLTCAHKKLPFGTRLKVTNEDNNKSVIVRVNDRGPFVKGRDLDLSKAAARKIGLIPYGVKKLKVEFLENE
ncbi:MAG: septal ring lytic transglycosylase RlpA family protein [Candidatus Cloacimonetes bacterium]|nr:septal ring lytic transglycosylase RlpA family protein [Candidatus Cloacimonadota bacterium]MCF7814313.1 septal ring lytic transglycosylase RlpA family protein [Candidatus Cloacimonadota bacterium]MCF7868390.1 septal ring lytic transglycosylase RlpA family protein [Candidatus Cloacimonadota bacterium]MCF7883845.1 septal ring lytic transglycosylase RlpA family protein [Candidatus Cloacimonadota bacterium]